MSEELRDIILGFWLMLAVIAFLNVCSKGCATVNDPALIKAEAEAHCKMYPKACAP